LNNKKTIILILIVKLKYHQIGIWLIRWVFMICSHRSRQMHSRPIIMKIVVTYSICFIIYSTDLIIDLIIDAVYTSDFQAKWA